MMSVIQGIDIEETAGVLSDTGMWMQGRDETGKEVTVQEVMTRSHHGAQGDVMITLDPINTPYMRETAAQGSCTHI